MHLKHRISEVLKSNFVFSLLLNPISLPGHVSYTPKNNPVLTTSHDSAATLVLIWSALTSRDFKSLLTGLSADHFSYSSQNDFLKMCVFVVSHYTWNKIQTVLKLFTLTSVVLNSGLPENVLPHSGLTFSEGLAQRMLVLLPSLWPRTVLALSSFFFYTILIVIWFFFFYLIIAFLPTRIFSRNRDLVSHADRISYT